MLDTKRAKEILNNTKGAIQVLYQGSPVWLEDVKENNSAVVSYIESHERVEVPVYKLVENNPNK